MRVLKIIHNAHPEYPMYIHPNLKEVLNGLESMLDGDDMIDYPKCDFLLGEKIIISIELTEMPDVEFEALEPWEP